MDREIIFRGKYKISVEWVYGDLAHHDKGSVFIRYWHCGTYASYEVDPETVCQYTGSTDKNGKKIFEGDILSFIDRECPDDILRELVAWNGFSWVTRRGKRDIVMSSWECEHMEVIGNIFDNPELEGDELQ